MINIPFSQQQIVYSIPEEAWQSMQLLTARQLGSSG
jgi:hypothetical protein